MLPVFEELNSLLFYPVQYEGEEISRNVFYTGAAPYERVSARIFGMFAARGAGSDMARDGVKALLAV